MAKISPVSIKYIIRANFHAEGVVEKPDVIGAIFGQTEGLLGEDLELRELQKEGKIGRIEVTIESEKGSTTGVIEIPASLDKAETALIAAALETIERVGPSEAKIKVEKIEDVRSSKREYVLERAKKLLKDFQDSELPETSELKTTITDTVRMEEITEYGTERLPAGPGLAESDEVIVVEGRADVLTLLKCGIKNAIAVNGTSTPETVKKICGEKMATLFVDGDRGGELITKDVTSVCDIKYIARAPDGKEVEELTKKEILKALRDKIEFGKTRSRIRSAISSERIERPRRRERFAEVSRGDRYRQTRERRSSTAESELSGNEKEVLTKMHEEIVGTRGAYLLDNNLEILGKVPLSELATTLKDIKAYAIVADGIITSQIASAAEQSGTDIVIAKEFVQKGNFRGLTFTDLTK